MSRREFRRGTLLVCLSIMALTGGRITPPPPAMQTETFSIGFMSDSHLWVTYGSQQEGWDRALATVKIMNEDPTLATVIHAGDASWDDPYDGSGLIVDTAIEEMGLIRALFSDSLLIPLTPALGNHAVQKWTDAESVPDGIPVFSTGWRADAHLYDWAASQFPEFTPYRSPENPGKRYYGRRVWAYGKPTKYHTFVLQNSDLDSTAVGAECYRENNPEGLGVADSTFDGASLSTSQQRHSLRRYIQDQMRDGEILVLIGHRALVTGVNLDIRPVWPVWGDLVAEMDSLLPNRWVWISGDTHEAHFYDDGSHYMFQAGWLLREHDAAAVAAYGDSLKFYVYGNLVMSPGGVAEAILGATMGDAPQDSFGQDDITVTGRIVVSPDSTWVEANLYRYGISGSTTIATMRLKRFESRVQE